MINIENNRTFGPQNLELSVIGEDGVIQVLVTDADRGEEVLDMFIEDIETADVLLGDLKRAIEEAF